MSEMSEIKEVSGRTTEQLQDKLGAFAIGWKVCSPEDGLGKGLEVGSLPNGHVAVRGSRVDGSPVLVFTPGEWDAFIGGVKDGEFDI